MTLGELFYKNGAIFTIELDKDTWLWVEGLDKFGCSCTYINAFRVKNVKNCLVELHHKEDEESETLIATISDNFAFTINTKVNELKRIAKKVWREIK